MNPEREPGGPLREPVRIPWIWVVITAVVVAGVPLYLPVGSIDPIWFGVPYWLVLSVAAAIVMSAVISVVCLRWWSLAEPEETARAAARTSGDDR